MTFSILVELNWALLSGLIRPPPHGQILCAEDHPTMRHLSWVIIRKHLSVTDCAVISRSGGRLSSKERRIVLVNYRKSAWNRLCITWRRMTPRILPMGSGVGRSKARNAAGRGAPAAPGRVSVPSRDSSKRCQGRHEPSRCRVEAPADQAGVVPVVKHHQGVYATHFSTSVPRPRTTARSEPRRAVSGTTRTYRFLYCFLRLFPGRADRPTNYVSPNG